MSQAKLSAPVEGEWETDDRIDLRYYWDVINRRKWSIVGLALAVGLVTMLVVSGMTPIYRASATLLLESQAANVVSIQSVYGLDMNREDYLATQVAIMSGRPIAEAVVDGLGLIDEAVFKPQQERSLIDIDWQSWLPFGMQKKAISSQKNDREHVIGAYLAGLKIEPVRGTQLVRVQFRSPDPRLAARVADAHAKAYIESLLNARVNATKSAAGWLAARVEGMLKELQASEAALQAYREQEQIVDAAGLKALPAAEISNLSARLLEVRQALAAAKIAYLQVTPTAVKGGNLLGIPALLADEGVRRAQAAQAAAQQTVAEVEKRYGPSHPKMVVAQIALAEANESLNKQANTVIEGIRKHYEATKSQEAAILAALNRAEQQYQSVGRKESKFEALQRAVDTNRQLYDLFFKRLSETSVTGDLSTAQARIVETAMVPRSPAEPNKQKIVTIAVVLALLFGVGVAFLLASVENTVKRASDVEDRLKRSLLGVVPLLRDEALSLISTIPKSDDTRKTDSRFAESMRTIRTSITLDSLDKPHRIILITSSSGHEGKSTLALNLAVAFGHGEKTLLIDGDLRRPSLGKMLGLPRGAPGLTELLTDNARLPECVIGTPIKDLDFISTGFLPPDPLQMLSSSRLGSALKVLAHRYSRIIIDCPPILPVSDAAMLSRYADCVLYVVKSDETKIPQISSGLGLLDRVNARILGIVVTQFDTVKASKYGDYGYGGYYDAYAAKPYEA